MKALTGWKPCQIPSAMQNRNMMMRVTMLIAARAASPYGAEHRFKIITEMLLSP